MNSTNSENTSPVTPSSVELATSAARCHGGSDSPEALGLGLPTARHLAPGGPVQPTDAFGQRPVSRRTRHLRKVRVILAELLRLEPEEIEADSDLSADLGADSLDLAELVLALEEEFETSMTDAEAEDIQTVEDILTWLDDNVED